ncbi:hypothetical protein XarjCFBP7645_03830 [Xanthomonas arboricola]|uniref:Uncharacterized protein n=1 Tax=Xanthomonas arboricola TaxID=56448 RepID=A0A2S7AHR0_9XANT|nr:hypothetical protein XarjCFBP7645_03830 [Xanthomonas arboricola]
MHPWFGGERRERTRRYGMAQGAGIGNRESGFGIWDLGFGIWDLGFGIWDLGFGIWDSGFGIRDSGIGNRDSGGGRREAGGGCVRIAIAGSQLETACAYRLAAPDPQTLAAMQHACATPPARSAQPTKC